MELTPILTDIQGLITNLEKSSGEFSKIKYRGGNESKIDLISKKLKEYLISKAYLNENNEINSLYEEEIKNVIMFLILNTEFKDNKLLDIKEYSHLINIMPAISQCLLMNIVINLELSECYGKTLQILPFNLSAELVQELIPCLKRVPPEKSLRHTFLFVKEIITKISAVDLDSYEVREVVEKLNDIVCELLLKLSGFNPDNVTWKKLQLYEHIGHTLLCLLKLLLICSPESKAQAKIIDELIRQTCCVVKAVTISIYCVWAEVRYNEQILQMVIGAEAYYVLEKYTKFKPAKELVQMLASLAKKPKSLNEQIQESSVETMIIKLNECNSDQRQWFTALLNTQVFNSEKSMDCLDKWSALCTIEDISRLLKLSMSYKTIAVKKLVLKCSANLSVEDLSITISRFFRQHGLISHLECVNIQKELICRLNKINHSKELNLSLHELESSTIKELQILFLQNPMEVTTILYNECIKNMVYTFWLRHAFIAITDVLNVDSLALKTLEKTFKENGINDQNVNGYIHLIQMLIETGSCDIHDLLKNVLFPLIRTEDTKELKHLLTIITEIKIGEISNLLKSDLLTLLLDILEKHRCKFTDFSNLNLEITIAATRALKILHYSPQEIKDDCNYSPLNKYYTNLGNYLSYIYPNFTLENYGAAVSQLIKILSRCVPDEWIWVTNEIKLKSNAEKCLEILTDSLILICAVGNTQNADNLMLFTALKYYVQTYGVCVKHLQDTQSSAQFEINTVKCICRLLQVIPEAIRYTEGVNLITVLSVNALKSLANDKQFVCSLVAINDSQLTQIIAKKMLPD